MNHAVEAKPNKKAKVTKPVEDPKVPEPEQQGPASDVSENNQKNMPMKAHPRFLTFPVTRQNSIL